MLKRLLLFAVLTSCAQALPATPTHGQPIGSISLDLKNVALPKVFAAIEQQTDYKFSYNEDEVQSIRLKRVQFKKEPLSNVLNYLESEANVAFKVVKTLIGVKVKPALPKRNATGNSENMKQLMLDISITGKVVDAATGEPLVGATVQVKGTNVGTQTDAEGNFALSVPEKATVLIVSFIGYRAREVEVNDRVLLNIELSLASAKLDEVVVAALGISRSEKSLGYSIEKVEGVEVLQSNEINLLNALSGRVAGLQITRSGNGLTGSSRVVLRGDRSLNLNQNQSLFVINGVPVSNSLYATNGTAAIRGGGVTDFGNAINEIDPNNIESITVLKGPSAAALYGSRGANGVILITTKSGKGKGKLEVTYNGSLMVEDILRWADYQSEYGAGRDGLGLSPGGVFDANNSSDFGNSRNHGHKFEGQSFLQIDANGQVTERPWIARADILNDFFQTGTQISNNISLSGGSDLDDFRLSFTDQRNTGIIPFTNLNRSKVELSAGFRPVENFELRTNIGYIRSSSDNISISGYGGTETIMYDLNWWQRNKDLKEFENFDANALSNNAALASFNPWAGARDVNNSFVKDRMLGQLQLIYKFSPSLEFMARSGGDYFNDARRVEFPINPGMSGGDGFYMEQDILFNELNTDFLLTYRASLSSLIDISASLGGNNFYQLQKVKTASIDQIAVPGTYNLRNSSLSPVITPEQRKKVINSLYAFAQIGIKNHTYIDLSARNDWSSTLPQNNNSYFYPSVSLSNVFTELLKIDDSFLSFGKVRLSYAQAGNDTDPYLTNKTFVVSGLFGNNLGVTHPSFIENPTVKPERTSTIEAGIDLRFFKNRLGLDVTYYTSNTKDQLILAPITETTGYRTKLINVGETKSNGIEILLATKPIVNPSGLNWSIDFNIAQNRSEVVELGNNIKSLELARSGVTIEARGGERYGDIYGYDFLRAPDGQLVLNNGLPQRGQIVKLGNYNPDWLGGISNSISYKGIALNFLFDFRIGGEIYSYTYSQGSRSGTWTNTLPGRAEGFVPQGVIANGDGTFRPNDVKLIAAGTPQSSVFDYYEAYYSEAVQSHSVFDASFAKLREVSLQYNLPSKWLQRTPIKGLTLSLVGRNLALFTDVPVIDPEVLTLNGANLVPGIESMTFPPTKTYGFSLNVKF